MMGLDTGAMPLRVDTILRVLSRSTEHTITNAVYSDRVSQVWEAVLQYAVKGKVVPAHTIKVYCIGGAEVDPISKAHRHTWN